jgi:hypothetical protein
MKLHIRVAMAQASGSEYSTAQKVGGVLFAGFGPFLYGVWAGTVMSLTGILLGWWQLDLITTFVGPVIIGFLISVIYLYFQFEKYIKSKKDQLSTAYDSLFDSDMQLWIDLVELLSSGRQLLTDFVDRLVRGR